MKIVKTLPPNWEEIKATFPVAEQEQAVFMHGGTLFNPFGAKITEDLKIHESVHMRQQGKDPEGWWKRYVSDKKFRLQEEAEAYSAQLFYLKNTEFPVKDDQGKTTMRHLPSRVTTWYLDKIAETLSGKLYGEVIDYHKARTLIRKNMDNFAV